MAIGKALRRLSAQRKAARDVPKRFALIRKQIAAVGTEIDGQLELLGLRLPDILCFEIDEGKVREFDACAGREIGTLAARIEAAKHERVNRPETVRGYSV